MKLTEFELDVMQLFWDHGRLSSSDVAKEIAERKGVAIKTVKTIVSRLEEKGAITLVGQSNKAFVYVPAVSQEEISNSLLPTFVRRLFGNNPTNLIAKIIENGDLNEKDVEHIQALLEKRNQEEKK